VVRLDRNKYSAFVRLPHHPVSFWLILLSPWAGFVALWITVNTVKKSFKPWIPWLFGGYAIFLFGYFVLGPLDGQHKTACLVFGMGMWTFYVAAGWLKRRYQFEIMDSPRGRWYFPWTRAEFSVPDDTHILVRNLESVAPWYGEKLGLRKATEQHDPANVKFKFKEDGKSVVLTTSSGFRTGKTPIFFTKKIGRMRKIMLERGVDVRAIEKDRQGISYFGIRDPEGNEIEIVQEP
jgi:predicted enzyme related to lactoylglutathione lyase